MSRTQSLGQTPIYSLLKDLEHLSDAEIEAHISQSDFIQANLQAVEEFLQVYMPCFAGNFRQNEVCHLDTHKKKSFTRHQAKIKTSLISKKPISPYDTHVALSGPHDEPSVPSCLSLEDALDLSLCMSFNPWNLESRDRLNPFKLHFNQKISQMKLGIYI